MLLAVVLLHEYILRSKFLKNARNVYKFYLHYIVLHLCMHTINDLDQLNYCQTY